MIAGGFSKNGNYHNDIVEYDPEEDSMVPVGEMIVVRANHAVSVVQAKDYTPWCH